MRRIAAVSALFGVALAALAAAGQKADDKQPPTKKPADKVAEKKADPTDAAIAAALAHDPDVRMARAKVQLADAELAKTRQAVTLKVITLRATIEEQKQAVAVAQEVFALTERASKAGQVPILEVNQARAKLESARSALARSELELKHITGGGVAGAAGDPHHFLGVMNHFLGGRDVGNCTACHAVPGAGAAAPPGDPAVAHGLEWLGMRMRDGQAERAVEAQQLYLQALRAGMALDQSPSVRGAVPDRIRAALDKMVKLGAKGEVVPIEKALDVFKAQAGLDVPVRVSIINPNLGGSSTLIDLGLRVQSEGEELPVGAWFQLYQDTSGGATFYVREYGILLADKKSAPPDALTLTQFWDLKPPAKRDEKPKDDPTKK